MNFKHRLTLAMTGAGVFAGLFDADPYWGDAIVGGIFLFVICMVAFWVVGESTGVQR